MGFSRQSVAPALAPTQDQSGPEAAGPTAQAGPGAAFGLQEGFGNAFVQMLAAGEAEGDVQALAAEGTASGGGQLPFLDTIQAAFGGHDVSGVSAHTGGEAAAACEGMGAAAFATGDDVAFGGAPDLHTAAHEAAHVVQQRAGVQLKGGVGEAGDPYERHADQVADAGGAGQDAAPLLDGGGGGGAAAVQRKPEEFHEEPNTSRPGPEAESCEQPKESIDEAAATAALERGDLEGLRAALGGWPAASWSPSLQAQHKEGRKLLAELEKHALTMGILCAVMAQKAWTFSPDDKPGNLAAAQALANFAGAAVSQTRDARKDPAASLLARPHPLILKLAASRFEGVSTRIPKLGMQSSTKKLCEYSEKEFKELIADLGALPSGLRPGASRLADLQKYLTWSRETRQHIEDCNTLPWYMWIPLVNIVGLAFWRPSREAIGYALPEAAKVLSQNTALVFGPIIIPILSAWQISIEPYKFIDITKAKIEVIQKLADPTLSDGEKWKHVLNFSGDRILDIAVGKLLKVPYDDAALKAGGATVDALKAWVKTNRRALLENMFIAAVKEGDKSVKRFALGLEDPSEFVGNVGEKAAVKIIKDLLGAYGAKVGDLGEASKLVYKLLVHQSVTASALPEMGGDEG